MTTQALDINHFSEKALEIRAQVPAALIQHGLDPKFTSWRLTQDPHTGLIVLFASLNDDYIGLHSAGDAEAYFDPQLLQALSAHLQVQVVPSRRGGRRYAFILDRGDTPHAL